MVLNAIYKYLIFELKSHQLDIWFIIYLLVINFFYLASKWMLNLLSKKSFKTLYIGKFTYVWVNYELRFVPIRNQFILRHPAWKLLKWELHEEFLLLPLSNQVASCLRSYKSSQRLLHQLPFSNPSNSLCWIWKVAAATKSGREVSCTILPWKDYYTGQLIDFALDKVRIDILDTLHR